MKGSVARSSAGTAELMLSGVRPGGNGTGAALTETLRNQQLLASKLATGALSSSSAAPHGAPSGSNGYGVKSHGGGGIVGGGGSGGGSGGGGGSGIGSGGGVGYASSGSDSTALERYWKNPLNSGMEDVVLIHVCDENRQVSKDFCCKRNILVRYMRYFERFLAENESGYDDIDISVHCDVEIFEWLMAYIHQPDKPPVLDKAIVVSILISSEFLQMDTLVDLCLEHIANSLGEIIRLPIDLSCISDKLVNKLAALTTPKTLALTKDRKDKILNKLYKRRVELDFSRKSGARGGARTIAASLTCCRYCGMVFLDNWVSMLTCRTSPPAIDFRGCLARRHSAITGWSLTSYLKTLHAGGMSWDAIYWHVWGACEVFRVGDVVISALEVDRYAIEADGITIRSRATREAEGGKEAQPTESLLPPRPAHPTHPATFSLDIQEDDSAPLKTFKMPVSAAPDPPPAAVPPSPSLSPPLAHTAPAAPAPAAAPARLCDTLPLHVFELLCSQAKLVGGQANKQLIESTAKHMVLGAANADEFRPFDYGEVLWANTDGPPGEGDDERRGRSRSPARGGGSRKQAQSLTAKPRSGADSPSVGRGDVDVDGDREAAEKDKESAPQNAERRSRSMGVNFRMRGGGGGGGGGGGSQSGRKKPQAARGAPGSSSAADHHLDPQTTRQLAILRAIPPDAVRRYNVNKGPVNSVWLATHPLVLYPAAYADLMNTIQDSNISDAKKLEWELDVLREYDEKRLDRLEAYLVSRRSLAESQRAAFAGRSGAAAGAAGSAGLRKGSEAAVGRDSYYRDRGRQAHKTALETT